MNLVIESVRPSAIVIAGASTVDDRTVEWLTAKRSPVCWYDITDDGLASGVHPASPPPRSRGTPDTIPDAIPDAIHDAGACAAASLACAVILGLELSEEPARLAL